MSIDVYPLLILCALAPLSGTMSRFRLLLSPPSLPDCCALDSDSCLPNLFRPLHAMESENPKVHLVPCMLTPIQMQTLRRRCCIHQKLLYLRLASLHLLNLSTLHEVLAVPFMPT